MMCQLLDHTGHEIADHVVDSLSPSIYDFRTAAKLKGMKVVMRRSTPSESGEEEDNTTNTVYYDDDHPLVMASIFPDIALYFGKKAREMS
jgi:hypothetical protein